MLPQSSGAAKRFLNWKTFYEQSLKRRPIITKIFTGSFLAGAGDIVAQRIQIVSANNKGLETDFDYRRTFSMIVFGALYGGLYQHLLFQRYSHWWPIDLNAPIQSRLKPALKTVAFHQFVNYPLAYFPLFFSITEAVRGRTAEQAMSSFQRHMWPLYKQGVIIWVPAMVAQFLFIPVPQQVLWVSTFSFCWSTYMSWSAL